MDLEKIAARISKLQRSDGRDDIEVEEINATTVSLTGFGSVSGRHVVQAAQDLGMNVYAEPYGLGSSSPSIRLLVCPQGTDMKSVGVTNFCAKGDASVFGT
jgi:hypothetical protein